jgi:REP element-mobilizing transposase RayT
MQMPQSLSKIIIHVVFSTKKRQRWFDPVIRCTLHSYMAGICRGMGCQAYRVGGTDDHVHLACGLARSVSVSTLVREVKRQSSVWLKQRGGDWTDFSWQTGYAAFTIGQSQQEALFRYIDAQMEHHKAMTFQEEYRIFLDRYGIAYNDKYMWD